MGKLTDRIRGDALLELRGVFPEAVLNRCRQQGIPLRSVERVDAVCLRLRVSEADLPRLRALAESCQCELALLELRGGSRSRAFLRRRIWLPLTALLTAAALLVSSLFLWEIDIYGCETLSRGRVLRALEDCGVSCGRFWPTISSDLVRSRMLTELPELAWMSLNMNASRAVVLIREREEKPEIYRESAACELLASHAGIVTRMTVLNGRPLVRPGQAVREGEVLVGAALDSLAGQQRLVRARAEVRAETWYRLTAISPAPERGKGSVRARRSRFALKLGEKRVNFYMNGGKMLDGYDKIVHEYILGADGLFRLPVALVREDYLIRESTAAAAQDAQESMDRLEHRLREGIDGEILQRRFSARRENGALCVSLFARCSENIAVVHELAEASPQ